MKRTLAIVWVVFCSGIALSSLARAQAAKPTLDQVLEKYIQAVGGKEAFGKLTTRIMTGSIESPATGDTGSLVPGTIEIDEKAPNKRMVLITFPGGGGDQRGFDGTAGWYVDPDEGPQDLPAEALGAVKLEAEFNREIRLKELLPKLVLSGTAKVNGRDAYVVEAPHDDGSIEKFYFDAQSGLMARDEMPVDVPDEGKTTVVNDFDDYREVDGVKLPFTVHQTSPDFVYVIRLKEIKHNIAIDEAKFSKPAANAQ